MQCILALLNKSVSPQVLCHSTTEWKKCFICDSLIKPLHNTGNSHWKDPNQIGLLELWCAIWREG